MPDDIFHVDTRDYDLFGHGGMLFWFTSSLVFALIYFLILLLPWIPLREYLALPSKYFSLLKERISYLYYQSNSLIN